MIEEAGGGEFHYLDRDPQMGGTGAVCGFADRADHTGAGAGAGEALDTR